MTHNHYIYIAVMALVSYAIRILPLTLIRKPIKTLHSVVSVLCALCDAGSHDLPGHCQRDPEPGCRCHGAGGRHCSCLVRRKPVSGICGLLCRRVRAGTVPLKFLCPAGCHAAGHFFIALQEEIIMKKFLSPVQAALSALAFCSSGRESTSFAPFQKAFSVQPMKLSPVHRWKLCIRM